MQTLRLASVKHEPEKKRIDFRSLLNRVRLSPLGAKVAVIAVFTLCWLLVVLVRTSVPRDTTSLEGSSLMALATSLQQGAVSGRDFQSMFGPGAQFLAGLATAFTKTGSPVDAYGMIAFFFCATSAILIAALLLVCAEVTWIESAVVYALCLLLNLFFDVLDLRTVLLLLNAAFAYRIITATTMREQLIWATSTGLLSFVSQLVTFQTGIYAVVVVVCALIAGSILARSAAVLLGIEVFVATLAAANIGLAMYFKLSSTNYGLAFDYQNYSLEILRGFHNSMGTLWQLPSRQTIVVILATAYVVGRCVMTAWRSDPQYACLFASMAFAVLVSLNTAFVSSDIPHITAAFAPMIVVLGLFAPKKWETKQTQLSWGVAVCSLLFVWPSFNFGAPLDMFRIIHGDVPARAAIRNVYAPAKPLQDSMLPTRMAQDLEARNAAVLAFPYDNQIAARIRHPFFAPVLESYAVSTDFLERYYIQVLDRQSRSGLDIIYGPDKSAVPNMDGIQAITRAPQLFEHIYRHFELVSNEEEANGHYLLRERHQPRDVAIVALEFSVPHQLVNSGILKLNAPSQCGLVRLEMQIDYMRNPRIFRPSGIEVSLSDGDHVVWQGVIRPLAANEKFVTFISPLPAATFAKVFGQNPVQSAKWDKIEYRNSPADMLGSVANKIDIDAIHCLDPGKFVEGGAVAQLAAVQ
jgi:hypothetical protein